MNKKRVTTPAKVHCFGFSAENPRTFTIFGSRRKESCGFFRNETLAKHVTHNLKKNIAHILIFVFGLTFSCIYGQNYAEFETELIKHHGMKDTLRGDNLWIYDKEYHKIKKTELAIFENSKVETYLVEMTWYLGYHVDEINCLFTFEPETKELKFVGDITANGFKPEFYNQLIGYSFPNKKSVTKFVTDFENLIKINNPGVKFENVYYEDGRTVFFQTNDNNPDGKRKIWRIIVLNHHKGKLHSMNIINPSTKTENKIE